ncbi:NAD(P)/FAD-dependent oxidoreductase [Sphingomonas canadensis]|uniref:NAD(P)/FAD-dependent oxidoreductase n=1 Tax=Sphingomonas canadensis TaxID=1219257 RepID=A0ABW3H209_9SPHN|nr:FAD-binding oxidoreductase [Sphingomonas canadensis]MCW3834692.1 FAD-binding oxidoreductase [Sphingomonas canadensis]
MPGFDFIVIGAGIAGLAAAASLSRHGRVALVEQEEHPCYHSSGRSAAIFVRSYGSGAVQAITTRAAALFAEARETGLFDALGTARGVMIVTPAGSAESGEAPFRERLTAEEAARLNPILRADRLDHGWWEPGASDIDVHAMQTGYLKLLRANGGTLIAASPVRGAEFRAGLWHVAAGGESLSAPVAVNASGGWADPVAALFGARPLGVLPKRRSAMLIDPPAGIDIAGLPMVVDADETLFFKPDAGRLMLSPADATPVEPHDCWPEDIDLAIAADRYEKLTGHPVMRMHGSWAGLRSFVPDENPLIGADPAVPGFYWLAALGGFGVQTAPALGAMLAEAVTGAATSDPALLAAVSPARIAA